MKKGDVGMTKRFSKKYENKGWAINYVSRYLSAPDATSLHHCLKNKQPKTDMLSVVVFPWLLRALV